MSDTVTKNRPTLIWADRMRNVAMLMVIAIHLAAPISQENRDYDTFFWWSGNFWDAISRPAVPLFVMLSGFLLLGRDYPLPNFLRRRFSRVLLPSLFWMLVYSFYNFMSHGTPDSLPTLLRGIVNGPVHYHLWYIYMIIGLYLMYPILRPWIRTARDQDYYYFFSICILGTWVYKTLFNFADGLRIGIYFEFFMNQGGHFVLGYYLGNKLLKGQSDEPDPQIRPWRLNKTQILGLAVALILLGSSITALGNWWFSKAQGSYFPFFYDFLTPNVSIATIGWFLLIKWGWDKTPLLEIEKAFAAASFGIYLAHVFVIDWWSQAGYYQSRCYPIVCIPMMVVMVGLFSFLAVGLIRSLPWGDKIT